MFLKNRKAVTIFSVVYMGLVSLPVVAKKAYESDCGKTALSKSECMIKLALKDIKWTYKHDGGGGITEIKSIATNVFRISISQEERIDHITYEFELKPEGKLRISKRSENSETTGK